MSDNSWHENGELPPLGIECEYLGLNDTWHIGKIAAHVKEGGAITCIIQGNDMWTHGSSASDFRPIKTERELAIEAAQSILDSMLNKFPQLPSESVSLLFDCMYEAGILRSKNES